MYRVIRHDILTGARYVYEELTDPAKAYDLAHELDAAVHLGRDDEETDKYGHPCVILIEDEDGNDVWKECVNARCPSVTTAMFQ